MSKSRGPLIAQQNHYYSDKLKLDNPKIEFQKILDLKVPGKIRTLIVMNPKVIIVGCDDGVISILNRSPIFTFKSILQQKNNY